MFIPFHGHVAEYNEIKFLFLVLVRVHEKSKIPFSYMLYAYSVKEPIGELNLN